ncbi:hypothetical protein [Reinekea blandensis]|nr:hypothetical protein [Reinekea blandensis]
MRHLTPKRLWLHTLWLIRSYITKPYWRRLHPVLTHPKIMVLEVLLVALWLVLGRGDRPDAVTLVWTHEQYQVSEDFLGVAIDAAMLTDGEWWSESGSPPRPLEFDDPSLLRWTQLLAPDWVRLGGTEADKLWLPEAGEVAPDAPQLPQSLFNDYLRFTEAVGARPFITVSTGPLVRQESVWQPLQLDRLLSWLPKNFNGHLEFGNEPGAHWLIFGRSHQIRFDQLAQEYQQAQQQVNDYGLKLAGPANAFWPEIGEPLKQLFGSSKDFLQAGARPDIFTWHYYPTQSSRCGVKTEPADWDGLLEMETIREFEKRNRIITRWLRRYSPQSELWLGETGPAQCGGRARLTDRFGASLWWLTHLGIAAVNGNQTVIRQSLVGGDYALLRYNDGYSPNPDFWASLLWQRTMGSRGLRVADSDGLIRAVAHCHPDQTGVLSMVIVNLTDQSVAIALPQVQQANYLDVTSTSLGSRYTLVDDRLAETLNWQDIALLPWRPWSEDPDLPGYSYRWLQVADVDACR